MQKTKKNKVITPPDKGKSSSPKANFSTANAKLTEDKERVFKNHAGEQLINKVADSKLKGQNKTP